MMEKKTINWKLGILLGLSFLSFNEIKSDTNLIKIISDRSKNEQQKITEIQDFISKGANVNIKSEDIPNFTPLMRAADLGYYDIVKLLLESKASINETDNLGSTALFYAARKGHISIVKLLLEKGASVTTVNKQGNNILLDILRSYGANLADAKDKETFKKNIYNIIELLIDNGTDINAKGSKAESGRTPIIWAASWRNYDLLRLFIKKKADLCAKDSFGNSIAYYLPDPAKDKSVTASEIAVINVLKSAELECDWDSI